jgi:hypothetical protein
MISSGIVNSAASLLFRITTLKKVVTMDPVTGGTYKGIEHVHLEQFLISL